MQLFALTVALRYGGLITDRPQVLADGTSSAA
jgi:hypothetical protein